MRRSSGLVLGLPLRCFSYTFFPPVANFSFARTDLLLTSVATDALERIRAVAKAARELRGLRRKIMEGNGWSLRALYRTLETPGDNALRDAHAALDAAVRAAYGMKEGEDILAFLLKLNLDLAAKEAKGEPITPPGLPSWVKDAKEFITGDCVTV